MHPAAGTGTIMDQWRAAHKTSLPGGVSAATRALRRKRSCSVREPEHRGQPSPPQAGATPPRGFPMSRDGGLMRRTHDMNFGAAHRGGRRALRPLGTHGQERRPCGRRGRASHPRGRRRLAPHHRAECPRRRPLRFPHRRRPRRAGSRLALPARRRVGSQRGDRSEGVRLERRRMDGPPLGKRPSSTSCMWAPRLRKGPMPPWRPSSKT